MLAALARVFRQPAARSATPLAMSLDDVEVRSSPTEVERRRQMLRDAILGFEAHAQTAPLRAELDRLGISFRMDDITELGVTAWAPVSTWSRDPGPRRAAWLIYRHRTNPWWTDAHAYVTLDGVTLLHLATMPTQLKSDGEQLSFRVRFGIVSDDPDWEFADDAASRLAGRIPSIWERPKSWAVPMQGYLPARDAGDVSGKLAGLVSGMVKTLERADPAKPLS